MRNLIHNKIHDTNFIHIASHISDKSIMFMYFKTLTCFASRLGMSTSIASCPTFAMLTDG